MDVLPVLSWLIFILLRFVYFILLVCITYLGAGLGQGQQYNHSSPFSLFRTALLSAGALWLWSHVAEFVFGCLIFLIANSILDSYITTHPREALDQLVSTVLKVAGCIAGVVWLCSLENCLFFIPLHFYLTYKLAFLLDIGRYDTGNHPDDDENHRAIAPDDETDIRRHTRSTGNHPGDDDDDTNEQRDTRGTGNNDHGAIAPNDETDIRRDTRNCNPPPGYDDTNVRRSDRRDDDDDTIVRRGSRRRGGDDHPEPAPPSDNEDDVSSDSSSSGAGSVRELILGVVAGGHTIKGNARIGDVKVQFIETLNVNLR